MAEHPADLDQDDADDLRYVVVLNHEEQYSIWPEDREVPDGWRLDGFAGTRSACLEHINEVWTDMRPLSLRQWLADPPLATDEDPFDGLDDGPDLVERLTSGEQRVELVTTADRDTLAAARADGLVFLRFPDTQGPAELAVSVPTTADGADDEVHGSLSLDWVDLELSARIDPTTLAGTATLVRASATGVA